MLQRGSPFASVSSLRWPAADAGHVLSAGAASPARTRDQIGFQLRRIFAGVRLTDQAPEGYLDIARKIESPRFRNVAPYTKRVFVHHFGISAPEELDDEFAGWVRESYAVGEGKHLEQPAQR